MGSRAVSFDDMKKLIGHTLPGGTFTVEDYENWLLCDVLQSAQMQGSVAHPLFAYICANTGIGMSLTNLFALFDATADDGPMQAEVEIGLPGELKTGRSYHVRAAITDVIRKEGRKTGVFDLMTYRIEILDRDDIVAWSKSSIIFPRRS